MDLIPFTAHSAAEAVAQIRNRLGPDAVVVHVRPIPATGLSRLFRKPRLEVLAYRPQPGTARLDLRSETPAIPGFDGPPMTALAPNPAPDNSSLAPSTNPTPDTTGWQIGGVLERAGFLPLNAQRVLDRLQQQHGTRSARPLAEEIQLARAALADLWRRPPDVLQDFIRPHVFVGPPGTGKTTCLAKWLTQTVLVDGRPAHVWRLDGPSANTAESLEIHCQVLGVPVERSWRVGDLPSGATHLIDLPGTHWRNPAALQDLAGQLRGFLSPHIHLVLNAAYDSPLLLAQARAFAILPVEDIILTHLDEETRWGKAWNLMLGINFPIRFLSAGQNIPGDFIPATPEQLFQRLFPDQIT